MIWFIDIWWWFNSNDKGIFPITLCFSDDVPLLCWLISANFHYPQKREREKVNETPTNRVFSTISFNYHLQQWLLELFKLNSLQWEHIIMSVWCLLQPLGAKLFHHFLLSDGVCIQCLLLNPVPCILRCNHWAIPHFFIDTLDSSSS